MKILMVLVMFSSVAFASGLQLDNYVKMQESLAADDFKSAVATHKLICDKDLKSFKKDYKDCGKSFKNMEELRNSFKSLSQIFIKNADQKEMSKFDKVHCPMADASWIQKKSTIANPYYGKSMLECGEKI